MTAPADKHALEAEEELEMSHNVSYPEGQLRAQRAAAHAMLALYYQGKELP